MKSQLILITTTIFLSLLLTSCSNSSNDLIPSETSQPHKTTEVELSPTVAPTQTIDIKKTEAPVSEMVETNDAETVLKKYLDAFISKKFDELEPLLYPDHFQITAKELVQRIKENDFKNSVEYSEYMITSITDYDDTHKLAKLLVKPSSGSAALEDSVGLVLSNNEWKVDLSLIVNTETSDVAVNSENKEITVTKVSKTTKLNGYEFNVEYRNNLKKNRIVVGWMNKSLAVLNTDKAQMTEQLGKANVGPQSNGSFLITFNLAEKVSDQSLTITGMREADSDNLPIPGKETFDVTIPLK
ncbi:hypothetical protein DFP94_11483 [Fontibacillus phaseoli]|uniref:Immunoglobulin-like protein involved in spore germination n=1 Tax=Fontibacillus phaseoli TaxID=1416533 RepID=A0A369B2R4_9BACL|nr:hypothetical protein [Fontibacillus phaseoli]RCX15635.1 hypothetical protein DFP94_11483 [Fontibacillus phaseoli]